MERMESGVGGESGKLEAELSVSAFEAHEKDGRLNLGPKRIEDFKLLSQRLLLEETKT